MQLTEQTLGKIEALKERFAEYKTQNPTARIRNAAHDLGVSEMELLCTSLGTSVTPLAGPWEEFLKEVKSCGYVMALTRNDAAVHERKGEYLNVSFNPHAGLVLGADIDLRLFMNRWKSGFAVSEPFRGEERLSFQFFDAAGTAVHKIYMTEKSNVEGYRTLAAKYAAPQGWDLPELTPYPVRPNVNNPAPDVEGFQNAWLNLKDTHDFYMMLRDFRLNRIQALELAPEGYAKKVSNTFHRDMLQEVSATGTEIMVFIGNPGCIQIHTGKATKLMEMNEWYNILDDEFNMHLNENHIAQSWIVKKPTADGIVTALECFDKDGEIIVQFFGKRKPGIPELEAWREIIAKLG